MPVDSDVYKSLKQELDSREILLVAVSKTKSIEEIRELYDLGQRDFAENYVQELLEKQAQLPTDIRWHFIGHLQSNKVKQVAGFVQLIQSVDSLRLLIEINKQAAKNGRVIDCLLQVHIAKEETKFGFDEEELQSFFNRDATINSLNNIRITGLMGMATFTDETEQVKEEFRKLKRIFTNYTDSNTRINNLDFKILSMGMSGDYRLAIEEGSNMVRIGSLIFGER
jgi:PLP dependent protein